MFKDHADMVAKLAKPGEEILMSLDGNKAHMLHMIMGDIGFYFEGLRQGLGVDRPKVIDQNIAKLSKRYHKGSFTNDQVNERADKTQKYTVDQLVNYSRIANQPGKFHLTLNVDGTEIGETVELPWKYQKIIAEPALAVVLIQALNGE